MAVNQNRLIMSSNVVMSELEMCGLKDSVQSY